MPISAWTDTMLGAVRREIKLHPKIYLGFQILFVAWCLYWWRCPPDPGKAVLLLAVVAAVVTIQPQMTDKHRLVWLLIVFVLFFVEFHAINIERAITAEQERRIRKEETDNFRNIAVGLQNSIAQSQQQFDFTMAKAKTLFDATQSVSALTKKNLINITGGTSFAYVRPQVEGGGKDPIALVVWNHGNEILTGVTIGISRTNDPNWGAEFFNRYTVGTIGPHDMAMIPISIIPQAGENGIDSYWIMISAQNGTVDETLQFRDSKKLPGTWAISFRVTERVKLDKNSEGFPIVMLRGWSDEPNPEQKVDVAAQIRRLRQSAQREKLKRQDMRVTPP